MTLLDKYQIVLAYTTEPDFDNNFTTHTLEVQELWNDDIVIQSTRQENEVWLQKRIKDGLEFGCDEYQWLYNLERSFNRYRPLMVTITRRSDSVVMFKGKAYLDDANWETIPKNKVTIEFATYEKFNEVADIIEVKKNILATPARQTLKANYLDCVLTQFEFQDIQTVTPISPFYTVPSGWLPTWPLQSEGWTLLIDDTIGTNNSVGVGGGISHVTRNTRFVREITIAPSTPALFPFPSSPNGWSPVYIAGDTYYVRLIESVLNTENSQEMPIAMGTVPGSWTLLLWSRNYFYVPLDAPTFDNGIPLIDAINYLLDRTGLTVSSHLLGSFSYGDRPAYYDNLTEWENTYIFQKSDIVKVNAASNATNALVSLGEILQELRESCNVQWTIKGDLFILEHRSFFEREGTDLRPFILDKKTGYTYEGKDIPANESWQNLEITEEAWQSGVLTYKALLVGHNRFGSAKSYQANVNYDVAGQAANESKYGLEGFVLVHGCLFRSEMHIAHEQVQYKVDNWVYSGTPGIYNNIPLTVKKVVLNGFLAPINRSLKLMAYNRPWRTDDTPSIQSIKKYRKEQVLQLSTCDFNTVDLELFQRSNLGWGQVDNATQSLYKDFVSIQLLHKEVTG